MSTLRERVDTLRGKETLTAFCKRVGVSRGTVWAAIDREEKKGKSHNLDHETAKRLVAGTSYTVAWMNGEASDPVAVAPVDPFAGLTAAERNHMVHTGRLPAASPPDEDAMRWRALVELRDDGEDLRAAVDVLLTAEFDRKEKQPTWGDFYHLTKRRLKELRQVLVDQVKRGGTLELPISSYQAGSAPTRRAKRT